MKLIYISHWRFPSDMTMTPLIMKTCSEFARQGVLVELWIPNRRNLKFENLDPFEYHNIEKNFTIKKFRTFDWMHILGNVGFLLMHISFGRSVAKALKNESEALFYLHDHRDAYFLAKRRACYVLEIHDFFLSRFEYINKKVFKFAKGFVVTNKYKMRVLKDRYDIGEARMLHKPNAVNIKQFSISQTQKQAREKLKLPQDKNIILYFGHLFDWKGVYTLAESAKFLKENEEIYFVGGLSSDRNKLRDFINSKGLEQITFSEHSEHELAPYYMRAADVLVLPNTGKQFVSKFETSPVKMFEYMSSGTPIIASDLPSLRNVVDESLVTFFKADDPKSLASQIHLVLDEYEEALKKANLALMNVSQYTWERRIGDIVSFLKTLHDE